MVLNREWKDSWGYNPDCTPSCLSPLTCFSMPIVATQHSELYLHTWTSVTLHFTAFYNGARFVPSRFHDMAQLDLIKMSFNNVTLILRMACKGSQPAQSGMFSQISISWKSCVAPALVSAKKMDFFQLAESLTPVVTKQYSDYCILQ